MDIPDPDQMADSLRARQGAIADAWCQAIAGTSFVPYSGAELRSRLLALTGEAIGLLFTEPLDSAGAERIGATLASFHCTQPEALGRTQGLLTRELLSGMLPDQVSALVPRVSDLLQGLATGFGREATAILLHEQESIRKALLTNLRATEQQLREARSHLEEQVAKRTEDLQASQERYRELLEEIDAAVLTVDGEGTITYASPPVARLFGRQPSEVVGKPFGEYIHAPDLPRVAEQFSKVLKGESTRSEFRILIGAGEYRWAHAATRPVSAEGQVVAATGVVTDITERKHAEEALRESEERWRTLLDNSPDPVLTLDREGRVLFVNYVRSESGLTLQEVLGQSALDRALPDQVEAAVAVLERVFETGESVVQEVAVRRPDGSLVWYACHVGPVQQDGQTVALVVARDITERKRAEEALRDSEERWRSLVTYAPDTVLTLDAHGRIQFVNHMPGGSGIVMSDMLGRRMSEMVVPEHREVVESTLKHVFDTGESAVYESAVQRPNGARIWYAAHVGPVWQGDRVVAAMLIARDVTERRRLGEMKDNLLRDVSHELRTPLTRAQMSLEMMLESVERSPVDPKGAARYGRLALDNISRLASAVRGILDLSRLEAGVGAFARETINLHELIAAVVRDMESMASGKGISLVVQVQPGLPPIRGDRERLWRVVHNLLDNALKFSTSGQIAISADMLGGEVVVGVQDSGCGILPENLARVFDRFFREDTANDGVGVGLPMCRTIIQAHGGRIWAESAGRGQGATFRFALPVPRRNENETPAAEEGQRNE